uniref:Venom protein family 1 protein 2 n=1 Tax=Platymeris rhadamanthus TaxID=1134088 RepID=F1P2_PLARH|nr:RecName: Full=Venom protein family 1 protein 2; Short=f1p2; Flags: Precursor [Platymeris rhadamanthus]QHB21469.1 venom protein family 1 protein 2 [Platymeris rhadamanthus]
MAKLVFISFLVASFCLIGCFGGEAEIKQFWLVRKNAIFQFRFATVEIEKTIYQKVKHILVKAKDDDQKNCIDGVKSEAIIESRAIVKGTVGKILPAIDEVSEALRTGDENKLKAFNNNWNYPEYKVKELANFKLKAAALAPTVQEKLDKCVA